MNDDGKVFRNYYRAGLDSHYFIRGRLPEQDMACMVEDVHSVFAFGTEEGAELERRSRAQAGLWQTTGVNT